MRTACSAGRITPMPAATNVTADDFATCTNVVALAGAEQIAAALETKADIVIAGRCSATSD